MRSAAWGLALRALVVSMTTALTAHGDIVLLKDGTRVEGDIIQKTEAGWVIKTTDGKSVTVGVDQVKSFEAKRQEEPFKRFESLRRSVDNGTDIPKVLERYRKFVEQYVGTPAADAALKEIEIWESRLSQGMVKVGSTWYTPVQLQDVRRKGAERAEAARQLLLAGRQRDAMSALDAAIGEDPYNISAHYLRGVVLYRQEQLANARKAFDTVVQLEPTHAPTHNNLAVIMWANKQFPGAINSYGQAMNLEPVTRSILDNVAEALNELPESQRDNAATKKVVLLFNAQDMVLQTRMKKRGLFRWGSTWVDEATLKQLDDEQDKIDERIARMEEEFEQVQDRIEEIERDVGDTERSIRRIEATSYGRDSSGRAVRMSYPRLYYDLKRDLEQLHEEREAEREKASRLRKKARDARQSISVPRYAGVQQIIGVEGTPGLEPLASAGQKGDESDVKPATAPATSSNP